MQPRIVTFNSQLDTQNMERVLGILLFWFQKYAQEP